MGDCNHAYNDRELIIYHLGLGPNDEKYLHKNNGVYADLANYWGNILIYPRHTRNDERYAYLMDANGEKCSPLTKGMFKRLKKLHAARHVYVNRLRDHHMARVIDDIGKMSLPQIDEAFAKLKEVKHERLQDLEDVDE